MGEHDVEIALLQNNYKHMLEKQEEQGQKIERLIKVVEKNNDLISKSKGVVYGASLIVSLFWAGGIAAWNYIK